MDWDKESVFADAAPEADQPEPAPIEAFNGCVALSRVAGR